RSDRLGAHHVGDWRRAWRHLPRQPGDERATARADAVGDLLLWPGLPRVDGQLQRLLQPHHPDSVLGAPRPRHGDRHALRRASSAVQRHLPLRRGRVMQGTSRLRGALLGGGLGILAGAIWFALETGGNWAAGGVVPAGTLGTFAALDVAVGASAGLI